MTSLRTLLAGAIDYAGLFPPARLDMVAAVRNYAAYLRGGDAWALGRFILPADRLDEFQQACSELADRMAGPWRLSALLGEGTDIPAIEAFNAGAGHRPGPTSLVDMVEGRASTVDEIKHLASRIPRTLTLHIEVPLDPDPGPLVDAIAMAGRRAKARTGGVTADAFPSSASLARFIKICAQKRVPFKATAGLHHPVRAQYSLTSEPEGPRGTMFGFLNVLMAAVVGFRGGTVAEIVDVLNEESAAAFRFGDADLSWRSHRMDLGAVQSLRNELAMSFGSCSFTEPFEGLTSLGLL